MFLLRELFDYLGNSFALLYVKGIVLLSDNKHEELRRINYLSLTIEVVLSRSQERLANFWQIDL